MIRFTSFIGSIIIRLLGKTMRVREVNNNGYHAHGAGKNVIFSFWHGEQFVLCHRHRNEGVTIMSSLSRDGEIQTGILQRLGYMVVRGSSTRGGDRALVAAIRAVKKGSSAAFAVDGPRGPYHEIKPGVAYLAMKTGRAIVPVSSASRPCRIFPKAWDKYELPLPFARSVMMYGEPVTINANDTLEEKIGTLQRSMAEISAFTHGAYWSNDVREYLAAHPRPKIMIIQPSRIGDVVFALPAVTALRKRFPRAWIGWMVDERCAPVIEHHPSIDECIIFDRRKVSPAYLLEMRRQLHARQIDVSIDFHGLAKSALMVQLTGARFKIASSSTNGMREFSWLFSREIRTETQQAHCVERHSAVARYLGADAGKAEYALAVTEDEKRRIDELLRSRGIEAAQRIVAVHPGGGWRSRRWFTDRYAALIDRLITEQGAQVLLVGGKEGGSSERGLNEEIVAKAHGRIIDMTGALNLRELAALLARCSVFVGNEAGPMHFATAMGVPSVAILGPTNARRTGPFGGRTTIIQKKVACQPCRERNCTTMECMRQVTVDEVFTAVKEQMGTRK